MLSAKLKEHTKLNHQLLEKKLVAQMKAIVNKQGYANLLGLFYSFFGGLEVAMASQPDPFFLPDFKQRRKSSALADDLRELGAELPALAADSDLPTVNNYLQTTGALYVMEGSTLGGKFIAAMLQKQLNMPELDAFSFFKSYGENTENMWAVFKNAIDGLTLNPDEEKIIIKKADETFAQFSNWFDHQQQQQFTS